MALLRQVTADLKEGFSDVIRLEYRLSAYAPKMALAELPLQSVEKKPVRSLSFPDEGRASEPDANTS